MIKVGFNKLNEDAILPVRAHYSDSGFDLFANEDVIIGSHETVVVKTGIVIHLPEGYEAQVRPRSGVTSKTKLRVQLGTIDNSYTGEIGIIVDNIATFEHAYPKGFKLAQLVIQKLPQIQAYEIEKLPNTERGSNGFGSSGY